MAKDRTEWRIVRSKHFVGDESRPNAWDYSYQIYRICVDGDSGFMQDYDSADWDGNLVYGSTIQKLKGDYADMLKAFDLPMLKYTDDGGGEFIEIPKE